MTMPWYNFANITSEDQKYLREKINKFADEAIAKLKQLKQEAPIHEREIINDYIISLQQLKNDPTIGSAVNHFGSIAILTAYAYGVAIERLKKNQNSSLQASHWKKS
ncbi:MAG: hypothetical protein NWF09_07735 [Candidatus Bathyarchaeota archaeon]|nr:hypothetical protein [Candidatus Bathyarchaeota archaeon]